MEISKIPIPCEPKKKSSNKTKINIKNDLLNISDKFLNNDSYKIDIYKSEYSFLLPHIYNFQYINLVNSKDIEVYKIDENQETNSFIISGTGDVLEPEGNAIGIGSGGNYALAAAKVLLDTDLSAEEVARKAIQVASEICVFTNNNIKIEKI